MLAFMEQVKPKGSLDSVRSLEKLAAGRANSGLVREALSVPLGMYDKARNKALIESVLDTEKARGLIEGFQRGVKYRLPEAIAGGGTFTAPLGTYLQIQAENQHGRP